MSFLRTGGRRAKIGVVVFTLVAFQSLALIGASVANAVTGCTFNPATNTINITIDPGQTAGVAVETTADNLDAESPAGAILFDNNGLGFENGVNSTQCGSASNTLTTSIVVLGSPSNDEVFYIDNTAGEFATAITWAIDLGSNTIGGQDEFDIFGNDVTDDNIVLTSNSFTINGGGGPLLGVEFILVEGGDGAAGPNDVIDASAVSASTQVELIGGSGDDWMAPGLFADPVAGGDLIEGDAGFDTISYATRTSCIAIDNNLLIGAGTDANCDGDSVDPGDEGDQLVDFLEGLESGSGNDTLIGAAGTDETFVPGDGDDKITGNAADDDQIDFSSSSAGVTIDPALGTATGQGTDKFTGVVQFFGSAFDDVLLWDGTTTGFAGGDGIDTVDASTSTTGQAINLDTLDDIAGSADSTENALGGSANDTLTGNDLRNDLQGNAGDDTLNGAAGNDTLTGGLGNDTFSGGSGADKISYATNTTSGINADMNLGFVTSAESGDDGFAGPGVDVEIVQGSPFNDTITGGGGLTTINFLFTGGNGKDTLTGSGSNDTLKGGAGNDRLRGLEGGDILKGGKGTNDKGWGGPGVDFCSGVEHEKGCE